MSIKFQGIFTGNTSRTSSSLAGCESTTTARRFCRRSRCWLARRRPTTSSSSASTSRWRRSLPPWNRWRTSASPCSTSWSSPSNSTSIRGPASHSSSPSKSTLCKMSLLCESVRVSILHIFYFSVGIFRILFNPWFGSCNQAIQTTSSPLLANSRPAPQLAPM